MTNLTSHELLMEHAKFPFPETPVSGTASSADIFDIIDEEGEGSSSIPNADDGSGEYEDYSGQGPVGTGPFTRKNDHDASKKAVLMVQPSCALFAPNGPSEIHLNRFRHLPHCLLNHFKFGSIFVLSRTTSLVFRQSSAVANNVCG